MYTDMCIYLSIFLSMYRSIFAEPGASGKVVTEDVHEDIYI